MSLSIHLGLIITSLVLMLGSPATAQPVATEATQRCLALPEYDFAWIPDAPTQIKATSVVTATSDLPEYCRVEGYITPHIRFELRLPTDTWNERFYMVGCGGFCGFLAPERCDFALQKGFASVVSDLGNPSTALDGKWAYNNRQAEIDFGYRGTHVTVLSAKALIEFYYGAAPKYSYYRGCSTGGRQGMVEAQRFPDDFDGIIAGSMPFDETAAGATGLLWPLITNRGEDGKSILSAEDGELLYRSSIARCDEDDGVTDGIIADPAACDFDPIQIQCKGRKNANCLTTRQVEIARKLYEGPTTSSGKALALSGPPPGSELRWIDRLVASGEFDGGKMYWGADFVRFMSFMEDPGPDYDPFSFDFDRDPQRLQMMEAIYTASNPDLRKFKKSGGKLIMYHGLQDTMPAENLIDYYETAERVVGGPQAMRSFAKLYLIPGMNHCTGGPGAWSVNYLDAMMDWVENGKEPDMLMSHHLTDKSIRGHAIFPLDPEIIAFTRPVFPYPDQARYSGKGDVNHADSWSRYRP